MPYKYNPFTKNLDYYTIGSSTTSVSYPANTFAPNTFATINDTRKIAYIEHNNDRINNFSENQTSGVIILDLGFVPTQPVIINYYN